jgi:hypothetical protein
MSHHSYGTNDCAPSKAYELMHAAKSADNHIILNHNMASDRRRVYDNDPVSKARIMGNVAACHQQTVITDRGYTAAACGAKIDGDMLSDGVAIANHQLGDLAFKLQILRNLTNHSK